jgi:hypothetical protein
LFFNEADVKQILAALIVISVVAAVGCSSSDPSTSLPTAPSSPLVTENFSGTVQVGIGMYDSHPFTVVSSGFQITMDLTSVGPPSTISMGFGIGAWDGTTCTPLTGGYSTVQAGSVPQITGNINAGTYCAIVFDVGNQSAPVTYTAVVLHY